MRPPSPHPAVPPEALARQARLQAVLRAMVAAAPSREAPCLQTLRTALENATTPLDQAWLEQVQAAGLVEEAANLLRSAQRGRPTVDHLQSPEVLLTPLALAAQGKRAARHHLDSRRTTIRFGFAKEAPALDFEDRDLQMIFLQAFRLEGLEVALDLGKRPRPLLASDLPLPAGVGGQDEAMDICLKQDPKDSPACLLERVQSRLPEGLRFLRWEHLPNHASGLGDLATAAHWRWTVPPELNERVQARSAEGMPSQEGLEGWLVAMSWEDGVLCLASRLGPFRATNPMKWLATWLGLVPAQVQGLTRIRVELRPDRRLEQVDRYLPKLKNLYEDAVLLAGGSNILLVDEDEDEPLRLG